MLGDQPQPERAPGFLQLRNGSHAGIVSAGLRARHVANAASTHRNKKPGTEAGLRVAG